MQAGIPSRTALRVGLRRAAHQVVDAEPLVLRDPMAVRILGRAYAEELRRTPDAQRKPHSAHLRAWVVARSRVAEDALAAAVARDGVRQYVLLGAGLDTFATRNPHAGVTVFEVDHPATQVWKREMLRAAGIGVPESACFVAVDFERDSLRERLMAAGFDFAQPAVVAWLGVSMYLTEAAFRATLALVGAMPEGSEAVLDYMRPRADLPAVEQMMLDSLASRVEGAGEPFRLFFRAVEMQTELAGAGLAVVADEGSTELNARFFDSRTDGLALRGSAGRLVHARCVRQEHNG